MCPWVKKKKRKEINAIAEKEKTLSETRMN